MHDTVILGKTQAQGPLEAFILDVSHYIQIIRPKEFFVFREEFDPNSYFITSGDAVKKTTTLIEDLTKYKENAAFHISTLGFYTEAEIDFLNVIDVAVEAAERMLADLIRARGDNCFLETEWDNHNLWILSKNPRAK